MKNKSLLFLLFFSTIYLNGQVKPSSDFYGIIGNIMPEIKSETLHVYLDNKQIEIKSGDKILAGTSLLTMDKQSIEMNIYKDGVVVSSVLIKENSDFTFNFDNANNQELFSIRYGALRIVSSPDVSLKLVSQKINIEVKGGDFGFVAKTDENKKTTAGNIIVFDKDAKIYSSVSSNNITEVKKMESASFEDDKISAPSDIAIDDIKNWKENSLFHFKEFPKNLFFALESLNIDSFSIESTNESAEKINNKNLSFYADLLTFQFGLLSYNKDLAVKLVYTPSISLLENSFTLGFYLPFNLTPYSLLAGDVFLRVNRNNNEWSFGTDQTNPSAIVFDIFDDTLLKINKIKYIYKDLFTINYGDYFNISDSFDYSLANFNSIIFYPMDRKSSFVFDFKLPFFETFIYAEDVLPKGLYGIDMALMTPYKSFKFKFDISSFIDCFDLMQFNNNESIFPWYANFNLGFDILNLPSFGFSTYISGGLMLPFTYNFQTQTSLSSTFLSSNTINALANSKVSAGFMFRATNTSFYAEFIFDSGLNKVGLFDSYFIATRETRYALAFNWLQASIQTPLDITNLNFGGRIRVKYDFNKYVDVETSYQITGPKYYDKLFVKVSLDSNDKWRIRHNFYSEWIISNIPSVFADFATLQENNVFYIGYKLTPFSGFDFNASLGFYPDFVYNYKYPAHINFLVDCYVTIKPVALYLYFKDRKKTSPNPVK